MTPARGFGKRRAEYSARAPPCEKPPITMRFEAIPLFISCSIIEWISSVARRIPSSSSGPFASNVRRSNLEQMHMFICCNREVWKDISWNTIPLKNSEMWNSAPNLHGFKILGGGRSFRKSFILFQ
jgi:hypothetical protein